MSWGQYVVTGAEGFLGSTIVRELVSRGESVIACVLSLNDADALIGLDVEKVRCDVTRPADLDAVLQRVEPSTTIVIHTAGIISIKRRATPLLESVNIGGTTAVIEACRRWGVGRLLYISSVHALPELPPGESISEVDSFDATLVIGAYAKTKAEATRRVLEADDLDRVIVHPSGLYGPGDVGRGHVTQLIDDLLQSRLPAIVPGGYDLADVRDVASGTIAAADHGRNGASYLLTGHYVPITWIAAEVQRLTGSKLPGRVPLWLARIAAPFMEWWAGRRHVRPLFMSYSLHTVSTGAVFSHALATDEWGYAPRPPGETVADTVEWLTAAPAPATPRRRRRPALRKQAAARRRQSGRGAASGS